MTWAAGKPCSAERRYQGGCRIGLHPAAVAQHQSHVELGGTTPSLGCKPVEPERFREVGSYAVAGFISVAQREQRLGAATLGPALQLIEAFGRRVARCAGDRLGIDEDADATGTELHPHRTRRDRIALPLELERILADLDDEPVDVENHRRPHGG